jgi:hypothetical protein
MAKPSAPEKYELVARQILEDLKKPLNLSSVEEKQSLTGFSGTKWEIDAKAWIEDGSGFLVVEARRYTKSRLKQEDLAAIAYRIQDIGAKGGIVVSPLPLQRGAELVARAAGIEHVSIDPNSTTDSYFAEYLSKRFYGLKASASVQMRSFMEAEVIKASDK